MSRRAIQQLGGVHEIRRREAFRARAVDGGQRGGSIVAARILRLLALLCRPNQCFRLAPQDVRFQPVVVVQAELLFSPGRYPVAALVKPRLGPSPAIAAPAYRAECFAGPHVRPMGSCHQLDSRHFPAQVPGRRAQGEGSGGDVHSSEMLVVRRRDGEWLTILLARTMIVAFKQH
jgi:hypothetical protein